jgi:hypothetical protein
METSIVKNQYVISLRNGMVAYIIADNLESIAGALQNNKFFNTKEQMMINTADIVAIMAPTEWESQKLYQRGWYQEGLYWYDKKGIKQEMTHTGNRLENAYHASTKVTTKADAQTLIQKLKDRDLYELFSRYYHSKLHELEGMDENVPRVEINTTGIVQNMKM